MKRMRGRGHRGGGGGGQMPRQYNGNYPLNRNHVFDSSGPDLRLRGTAQQLFEKYLQLGRDATGAGDRVLAEGYFQHADHYFRIVNAINQATQQQYPQQPQYPQGQQQQQYNGNGQRRYQEDDESDEQPGVESREIPIAAGEPKSSEAA